MREWEDQADEPGDRWLTLEVTIILAIQLLLFGAAVAAFS